MLQCREQVGLHARPRCHTLVADQVNEPLVLRNAERMVLDSWTTPNVAQYDELNTNLALAASFNEPVFGAK